ncbi:MAG: 4-oxalocrotonate tautomerase [Desulfuromonas sp.]|jgi:4-oxalocrotonate tautomerase family enzyme|nr:MAG: 4-oxalocrotonate tautomerase [Desulfuromonas sp.]
MPHINVSGPKINELDKKRALTRALTDAAAAAYDMPRETIVVIINENSPENVSVGGQLIVDRTN